MNKLTAIGIAKIKEPGRYGDGGGMYLQVGPGDSKAWIFRFKADGRERAMGLGPFPEISLADARMKAAECRRVRAEKADPLDLKNAEKQQRLVAEKGQTTFKDCAEAHVSLHEVTWENPKHRQQWRNTLSTYAYPVIGQMAVAKIETIAFAGGGWNGRTGRFGLAESVFTHYEGTREVVTCRPLNGVRPKG